MLGGGVIASNQVTFNSLTNVRESAPAPVPDWPAWRAWTVAISNGHDVTNRIYIRVICAYPLVGRQVVSTYHTVPSGGIVRTTAVCPSGKVVLGGGAMVNSLGTDNFKTLIRESGPGTLGGNPAWLGTRRQQPIPASMDPNLSRLSPARVRAASPGRIATRIVIVLLPVNGLDLQLGAATGGRA